MVGQRWRVLVGKIGMVKSGEKGVSKGWEKVEKLWVG